MVVVVVPMTLPKSSGSQVSSAPQASGSADKRETPAEGVLRKKIHPLTDALFEGIAQQLDKGEAER